MAAFIVVKDKWQTIRDDTILILAEILYTKLGTTYIMIIINYISTRELSWLFAFNFNVIYFFLNVGWHLESSSQS